MKVSVVVATYNSPPELDDLVASLDAQSLRPDEFEVILVDDGSTDDTYERVSAIVATRMDWSATRIPSSGWPGRPRNVGVGMATGEYVFFSDHDDYFFPEALERMYAFAALNDLDIVHPKEVVSGSGAPYWVTWRRQVPRVEQLDRVATHCPSPHKLYRRAFLEKEGIAFPEGKVRLEDFSLNALAWSRTDSVGLLADYPCYRWHLHGQNTSKVGGNVEEYWPSFRRSLQPILEDLPPGPKRDRLLARWYEVRPLRRVKRLHGYSPDEAERAVRPVMELLPLFPAEIDALLTPADRARSALLRQGDVAALQELAELDKETRSEVADVALRWQDGELRLTFTARLVGSGSRRFAVEAGEGSVRRIVPEPLRHRLGPDALDLTEAMDKAFGEVILRSRGESVDWTVDARSTLEVVSHDGVETIQMEVTATIDPRTAAMGNPLGRDVWDVFFRLDGLGFTGTRRLPARGVKRAAALVDGQAVIARRAGNGSLVIDTSRGPLALVHGARPTAADLKRAGRGSVIPLPGVHASGRELTGWVSVGERRVRARVVADSGQAVLRTSEPVVGPGKVRVHLRGRRSRVLFELEQPGGRQRVRRAVGRLRRRTPPM